MHDVPLAIVNHEFISAVMKEVAEGKGLIIFGGPYCFLDSKGNISSSMEALPIVNFSTIGFRLWSVKLNQCTFHEITNNIDLSSIVPLGYNIITTKSNSEVIVMDEITGLPMILTTEYGKGRIIFFAFTDIVGGYDEFDKLLWNSIKWVSRNSVSRGSLCSMLFGTLLLVDMVLLSTLVIMRRLAKRRDKFGYT
jgi:uncharacterized membrane protein